MDIVPLDEDTLMGRPRHQYHHYRRAVYSYPTTSTITTTPGATPAKKSNAKSTSKDKDKLNDQEKDVAERDGRNDRKRSSLMADARAEHLLLAAQRLGRERAFILGGLLQVEKDKEKGKDRRKSEVEDGGQGKEKEKEKGPKTPKRHGVKMGHKDSLVYPSLTATGTGMTPATPTAGPGRGLFPVPTQGSFHLLNTPTHHSGGYSMFPISSGGGKDAGATGAGAGKGRGRGKGKTKGRGRGRGKEKGDVTSSSPFITPHATTAAAGTSSMAVTTPTTIRTQTQRANPPTPLDSLLSAARSLMEPATRSVDEGGFESTGTGTGTRTGSGSESGSNSDSNDWDNNDNGDDDDDESNYSDSKPAGIAPSHPHPHQHHPRAAKRKTRKRPLPALSMPESPVPAKRRKVSAGTLSGRVMRDRGAGAGEAGGERVRSALDVLADQAAVAATPLGKSKNKGKGKEKERDNIGHDPSSSSLALHARPPRTPLAENGTWSTLKPVQWGDEDASSSPMGDAEVGGGGGEKGQDRPSFVVGSSTGISRRDQAELERMVLDTLVGAEQQTQALEEEEEEEEGSARSDGSPSLRDPLRSASQLPRAPTPDVFGPSTSRATATESIPAVLPDTTMHSRSEDERPVHSNSNSQPNEGLSTSILTLSSTSTNIHQRSASTPATTANNITDNLFMDPPPGPDSDQFGNMHIRRDTAPELNIFGLTTMSDFELSDDMVFGGEDAELERAMHRDLAKVSVQDGGMGLDTPSKRPRSPYVKWSKEEDDLLAQVSPCLQKIRVS